MAAPGNSQTNASQFFGRRFRSILAFAARVRASYFRSMAWLRAQGNAQLRQRSFAK